MIIPRDLAAVEAVYRDYNLDLLENYWFSYRNQEGRILHAFSEKIVFPDTNYEILLKDILNVSLHVPSIRHSEGCEIVISIKSNDIRFSVNTMSKGRFLDIFTIQKFITRRVIINRSAALG